MADYRVLLSQFYVGNQKITDIIQCSIYKGMIELVIAFLKSWLYSSVVSYTTYICFLDSMTFKRKPLSRESTWFQLLLQTQDESCSRLYADNGLSLSFGCCSTFSEKPNNLWAYINPS